MKRLISLLFRKPGKSYALRPFSKMTNKELSQMDEYLICREEERRDALFEDPLSLIATRGYTIERVLDELMQIVTSRPTGLGPSPDREWVMGHIRKLAQHPNPAIGVPATARLL